MKLLRTNWLLIAILVLAIGLRIPLLNGSFWLDEAAQALESARQLSQQFDIIPDFQPPLLHLMVHFALYISDSEWWLRTIGALIPGIITIFVTYKIGEKLGGRTVAILAAILLSTSSFHIFYSQELRQYSLPAMFAVLSWWSLLQAIDEKKQTLQNNHWLLFALWSGLGLYASFLYPFLMIGQAAWILVAQRKLLFPYLISAGIAIVSFIPWLPIFRLQLAAGGQVRQDLPGWAEVVSIPQLKSLPLVLGKFIYGVMDLQLSPFFIVSGLVLAGMSILLLSIWWQAKPTRQQQSNVLLVCCWIFIPLLTAWVISFWIPVVQPKRVLYLLPAFYLLIGVLSVWVKKTWIGWGMVALLLIINGISTVSYYFSPALQRENWRTAHQEIIAKYPRDTIAVFAFDEPFAPWRWYDDGSYPTFSQGTLHISQVEDLTQKLKVINDYQYVIVFDYLRDLSDPDDRLLEEVEAFGYRGVELLEYSGIGFIRIYARPEAVIGLGT